MEPIEFSTDTEQPEKLTHAEKEQIIRNRCTFLTKIGLWPRRMQPQKWLQNFRGEDEQEVAFDLLKNFMYYSDDMTRELLRSAIRKIMPHVLDFTGSATRAKNCWASVARKIIIVPVQDDVTPSSADSGYHYARVAREMFGLSDTQTPLPAVFLESLPNLLQESADGSNNIVVFVDDFVGSGKQFIQSWNRESELSCRTVASHNNTLFFYCPLMATQFGLDNIREACGTGVTLCPAHILPPEASALHINSRTWSNEQMRQKGFSVLRQIAARVPMPSSSGRRTTDWRGFYKLGLNIVLNDAVPDACLGVFRFDKNNWHPLYNKAS